MIELYGLRFGYRETEPVIADLSYRFLSGTVTALTGQSGSGKSTLLYLIGLLLTPNSGRLYLDGVEVSGMPDAARSALRAERMGFVFQDALLDPSRSVLDNVCEGAFYHPQAWRGVRRRAGDLLQRFGVHADPSRRPGQISGGQAQRVALCRALIADPQVVLADEPSGNLDQDSADLVWGALRELATDGATVIVATHDRHRAAGCDDELRVDRADAA